MATRLYLESGGASAVSPAFSASWESTADADRVEMNTTKAGTAMTSKVVAGVGTNPSQVCYRQFVGRPMAAGNVFTSGEAIKLQMRGLEAATTDNFFLNVMLRVYSQDGTTFRATIRGFLSGGTEWSATALTNRTFSSTLSASYTTVLGDRLVLDVGVHCTSTTTADGTLSFGSDHATDLPEDTTTTDANNPWLELVTSITFADLGAGQSTLGRQTRRRRR